MRKSIISIMCLLAVVASVLAVSADTTAPRIYIDGELQVYAEDVQPRLVDGRVLIASQVYADKLSQDPVRVWLPIRDIATATGAQIAWDAANHAVRITTRGGAQ